MSRIGKKIIDLPKGIEVKREKDGTVAVKGKLGQLTEMVDTDIIVNINPDTIEVKRPTDQKRHKALHGLYRSLIQNMIIGVSQGYKKSLELIGVGYKATVDNDVVELSLGYSHPIYFVLPKGVKGEAVTERGKNPIIHLTGFNKQLVNQVAAKIRSLRKPEPYKGKGVRYLGEQVRRKEGKTASK